MEEEEQSNGKGNTCVGKNVTHTFIHLVTTFKHLLCARHSSKCLIYNMNNNEKT